MKSRLSIALSALVLISVSQISMAKSEKLVRTDRVSVNKAVQLPDAKVERIARTDRIIFNKAMLDQPSLQPKRIVRNDRIVFNKM